MEENTFTREEIKYLELLSKQFPTQQSVCTEIINLTAILNLPKGTEHFMSDIHGEYGAFRHILNNCSGVIREKVELVYGDVLSDGEKNDLCTLIYYPKERMELLEKRGEINDEWYRRNLNYLIEIARVVSSKYTRSKVRKKLPKDFAYIIDELLHAFPQEDGNQQEYHRRIIDTIIGIQNGREFVLALVALIKDLAVDHLHVIGDIYDRGSSADRIIDLLMEHNDIDIQWGNHDVLWMGASAGSYACIANVIRNNIRYENLRILENGYGVSLRPLTVFAEMHYSGGSHEAAVKAINVLTMKLEGMVIKRHPEYGMNDRLLFEKMDFDNGTIELDGKTYKVNTDEFPTVDPKDPYKLTEEEELLMQELKYAFIHSVHLDEHIEYLYQKGSMYLVFNDNLLFHGCIPMNEDGSLYELKAGDESYSGKALMDYCDRQARRAYYDNDENSKDFLWYLWSGYNSPCCGRILKTWERTFIDDKEAWKEKQNTYFDAIKDEKACSRILEQFGLTQSLSHIINGHTPIRALQGESPIKGGGKVLVIDGGFCEAYHKTTGIAGYTLIYNSHGMRINSHEPFTSKEMVVNENADIKSTSETFEEEPFRVLVLNTDIGSKMVTDIRDLQRLLKAYRMGIIRES